MKNFCGVLLYLLYGAIINIVVAWTCVLTVNVEKSRPTFGYWVGTTDAWRLSSLDGFGSTVIMSTRSRGDLAGPFSNWDFSPRVFAPSWGEIDRASDRLRHTDVSQHTAIERHFVDGRGWPMRSYWCVRRTVFEQNGQRETTYVEGGIPIFLPSSRIFGPRAFPYRPILGGIIVNSMFYGATFWLCFASPTAIGRVVLRRLGLDPKDASEDEAERPTADSGGT